MRRCQYLFAGPFHLKEGGNNRMCITSIGLIFVPALVVACVCASWMHCVGCVLDALVAWRHYRPLKTVCGIFYVAGHLKKKGLGVKEGPRCYAWVMFVCLSCIGPRYQQTIHAGNEWPTCAWYQNLCKWRCSNDGTLISLLWFDDKWELLSMVQVVLYDLRAGERGGVVQRIALAAPGQPLYTQDWCSAQGGLLGAAGAERCVNLVEPRK
jgi:hypothetical protein